KNFRGLTQVAYLVAPFSRQRTHIVVQMITYDIQQALWRLDVEGGYIVAFAALAINHDGNAARDRGRGGVFIIPRQALEVCPMVGNDTAEIALAQRLCGSLFILGHPDLYAVDRQKLYRTRAAFHIRVHHKHAALFLREERLDRFKEAV